MAILVAYASKHGSTREIAERIAEKLRQLGKQAEVRPLEATGYPGSYEAIGPRDQRVFFGAIDHHMLSFAERMMVKAVRAPEGDYRDWEAIEAWAASIAQELD